MLIDHWGDSWPDKEEERESEFSFNSSNSKKRTSIKHRTAETCMNNQTRTFVWADKKSFDDFVVTPKIESVKYLVVGNSIDSDVEAAGLSSDGLTVIRDRFGTERWSRLSQCLPTPVYLLAVRPCDHSAVAISAGTAVLHAQKIAGSSSLNEAVRALSGVATTTFVDNQPLSSSFQFPKLTLIERRHADAKTNALIQSAAADANTKASSTAVTALRAGLFLLNDFFDDSHSCSQSIEGMGTNHTGDYWHAILHRREPDYGNAKYWFRHVGRHPVYSELAKLVDQRFAEANVSTAAKLQRWKSRLINNGSWEPFAFVDLCEAAENDADLRAWCEQVQYDEMLLLLESSARDVFGR